MQQETIQLAKTIRAHVHPIRLLYQPLVLLAEKKVQVDNSASRSSEEPLPVNMSALQLVWQVDKITVMLTRAAGWNNPHNLHTIDRLIWLDDDRPCAILAQRDDADHIESLLASLHRHMEWMLYGNTTRKYIGVCPHCCGQVWLPESDDLSGTRHCEHCDNEFDVRQVCQASTPPGAKPLSSTSTSATTPTLNDKESPIVLPDSGARLPPAMIPEGHHMQPTSTRIRDDIHDLREQTATLEELATRRIRIPRDCGRGMTSAPTPINLTAFDLLDQTLALARMLATTAGLRYGHSMSVHGLLKGLDREQPCAALAIRQDAWDIVRLIDDAAWHARQLTDPEPPHRYIGVCERCGYGVWIPETQPINETDHRCVMCGHRSPLAQIAQAHELRLLTSGTIGTSRELRATLASCGITLKAGTLRQWVHRHRLKPVGTDDNGVPVYALADVLLLARGFDKQRV